MSYPMGSQSPYGAMSFATWCLRTGKGPHGGTVAIPLRGYVVCNPTLRARAKAAAKASQSPYGAMSFATNDDGFGMMYRTRESQSPYGAMSFATPTLRARGKAQAIPSQSPYGAMSFATIPIATSHDARTRVAIPLRGYVVCNA